jgi:hypothetical protein
MSCLRTWEYRKEGHRQAEKADPETLWT